MTFEFELSPEEFNAALKRLLSQSHDGLRFAMAGGQTLKFLYPPKRIVARGFYAKRDDGGTVVELKVPVPGYRVFIHAPLGLVVAGIGVWQPENSLGQTPVWVGLGVFFLSLGGALMSMHRVRDRIRAVLSHNTLKPVGGAAAALGLEGDLPPGQGGGGAR